MADPKKTDAEAIAFLNGMTFAYRRAMEMLDNGIGGFVSGNDIESVYERLSDAVRCGEQALGKNQQSD